MILFLLYFGLLCYILHFMILDLFVFITLQYRTGGPRPASKLRSLFYVCTLHCVLQSLLINDDIWLNGGTRLICIVLVRNGNMCYLGVSDILVVIY
jgi:hypothetical protein